MQLEKPLYKKLIHKDKKAQLTFYKYCFATMMRVAYRYKKNKDDAAVLVNDSLLKILTNIEKYSLDKPLEAWIRRVVINTAIDDFRKNENYKELIKNQENFDFIQEAKTDANIESSFNLEAMHKTIQDLLSNATRIVFYLYAIDGFKHNEIAEKLSISEETSKWHVKTARKILKENKDKLIL